MMLSIKGLIIMVAPNMQVLYEEFLLDIMI
ncbi:hypothetical protein CoNPh17_CDS0106 [Staphylococcus phage S-CoN_Ph17]|nr:hypothetical protein CoNPh17_CDS0106 [Staphylococcus phage S-CoN_Ph17]